MVGIDNDLQIIMNLNQHILSWCLLQINILFYDLSLILGHIALVQLIDEHREEFLAFVGNYGFPFARPLFLNSYIIYYFSVRPKTLKIDNFNA